MFTEAVVLKEFADVASAVCDKIGILTTIPMVSIKRANIHNLRFTVSTSSIFPTVICHSATPHRMTLVFHIFLINNGCSISNIS